MEKISEDRKMEMGKREREGVREREKRGIERGGLREKETER